ncbi:hypothetical protein ACEPAF_323 [Sanghuangporus sanghuang]
MSSAQVNPFLLPPLDKYNLIGTCISMILYGTNVVLFFLCMYVLLKKKAKCPGQWPLVATSSLLFILASIHIGASVRQLLECFVDGPRSNIPGASILYWLDFVSTVERLKGYVYTFIDTTQDLVLIWRLYVVWDNKWLYALLPFLLEVTHFGNTSANGIQFHSNLPLVAYILVIIINVGTTGGIAIRLWYMGQRHANNFTTSWSSVSQSSNRYLAPIFTIVESGAIFTLSSIVLLALFVRGDPKLEPAVNVATQLAATTPLLIIVRVGFGITHSLGSRKGSSSGSDSRSDPRTPAAITEVNVFRAVESDTSRTPVGSLLESGDYALDDMRKNRPIRSLADSEA